jgi:hypothetical protein
MGMPVRSKETRTTRPRVSKRVDEAKTQMNGNSLYDDPTLPTKTSATRTVKPNTQLKLSGCVRRLTEELFVDRKLQMQNTSRTGSQK